MLLNFLIFVAVKLVSFIISLIVLTMSMVPCCTSDVSNELNSINPSYSSCCNDNACKDDNPNPNGENNGCDFCSPFFTCGTCGGFVFQENKIKIFAPNTIKDPIFSFYNLKFYSEYYSKLWQPPKLSFV